jgi:hypothetical protein
VRGVAETADPGAVSREVSIDEVAGGAFAEEG